MPYSNESPLSPDETPSVHMHFAAAMNTMFIAAGAETNISSSESMGLLSETFDNPAGQSRPGAYHGKGGRRAGTGAQIRASYETNATISISRQLLKIIESAGHSQNPFRSILDEELMKKLHETSSVELPKQVVELRGSLLGVCTNFPSSRAPILQAQEQTEARPNMRFVHGSLLMVL